MYVLAVFFAGMCYYSVRLYRNVEHQGGVSAVLCMCLYHQVYIKVINTNLTPACTLRSLWLQHCDEVIARNYTGMSTKGEGRSEAIAEILEDKVEVHSSDPAGIYIQFDKRPTQVHSHDGNLNVLANWLRTDPEARHPYARNAECQSLRDNGLPTKVIYLCPATFAYNFL